MNNSTEGVSLENPSDNFMQVVPQTSRTIAKARYNQYTSTPPKVEEGMIRNSFFSFGDRYFYHRLWASSRQAQMDQEPVKP